MPAPTVDTARVVALMNEAAEAAAGNLTTGIAAGFVGEGTEPMEFVPGDGAVAVAARMRGLDGTIVLSLSAEMAQEVLNGPYGSQGILGSIEPGLRAAAAVLDQAAPRALRLDDFREVPPNEMFAGAGEFWWFGAVPLFRTEEHLASLAVFLLDPELVAAEAAVEDEEANAAIVMEDLSSPASYTPPPAPSAHGEVPTFDPFAGGEMHGVGGSLKLLHDVEMEVTVELGRTKMIVRNILGLTPGSVIELDRAAGAPVDLLVNGTLIGRGEVVVIDEEFGVRISEIVGRVEE
jgi:flagellar motor switch protein FliN/FliY